MMKERWPRMWCSMLLRSCLSNKTLKWGNPWVAQRFSACLRPREWSWSPGIESCIRLPTWSLLLPLPVSLPLSPSLCLLWINKNLNLLRFPFLFFLFFFFFFKWRLFKPSSRAHAWNLWPPFRELRWSPPLAPSPLLSRNLSNFKSGLWAHLLDLLFLISLLNTLYWHTTAYQWSCSMTLT